MSRISLRKTFACAVIAMSLGMVAGIAAHAAEDCDPADFIRRILPESAEPELHFKVTPHEVELNPFSRSIVKSAQNGQEYTYFVDDLDRIHFSKGDQLVETPGDFLVIHNAGNKEPLVIKESGLFTFNPTEKKFVFESKHSWDLAPDEAETYLAQAAKADPDVKFTRVADPALGKTRVLKCLDIMNSRNKGKNFIWDTIVSSNVVTFAGVVTSELTGNHLLSTSDGRRLVESDFIANNISTLITGPIVKRTVMKKVSLVRDFATRTSTDYLTNITIKRPLYDLLGNKKPKDEGKKTLGQKLVPYDTGFGVVRFFPKRYMDRALVYQIPRLLISSCLKGSALSVIVGPRMIRIADRYTWGLVYLGGRKVYLNSTEGTTPSPSPAR